MLRARHHRDAAGARADFRSTSRYSGSRSPVRFYNALTAPLQILVILALGASVLALGVRHVTAVHEARASRLAVCRAELKALKRDPFVAKFIEPADPCEALRIVAR